MQLRLKKKRSLILNVTSLIDVMFLLLIFFMVSTTFLSTPAIKLELPTAQNADPVRQNPLVVFVDAAGQTYLNDEPVNMGLLGAALALKLEGSEEKAVVLKVDGWNDFVIRCEGKHIQIWVNGLQTVDYTEADDAIARTGIIGLQIHGGPPAEASYKDIRIKVLGKQQ